MYEATFHWPFPAREVILTGDFDNWEKSVCLKRIGSGFTATVKLPYNSTVHYKFFVDGAWRLHDDLPKQANDVGIMNNVLQTPLKPVNEISEDAAPEEPVNTPDVTGLLVVAAVAQEFLMADDLRLDMQKHAKAFFALAASWGWGLTTRIQLSGRPGGKFEAITHTLLLALITESEKLGGRILDQFWSQLGDCHPRLKGNIATLGSFISDEDTRMKLFDGLRLKKIDFSPVQKMAGEYFTHLCVAIMNPGGPKSGTDTLHSVTDIVKAGTNELLEALKNTPFGNRRQTVLKALAFKRDGDACLLTGTSFQPFDEWGVFPALAHILPNSIYQKPETLACIAMLAGNATQKKVVESLNNIGNVMNLQMDAHKAYDRLLWGIEAVGCDGKIKYIFRSEGHPQPIRLNNGDEIKFGKGASGHEIDGPLPELCNLQLAVARIMKVSGAADIILKLQNEADDGDFPEVFIASEQFLDILDAKLILSGRTVDIPLFPSSPIIVSAELVVS